MYPVIGPRNPHEPLGEPKVVADLGEARITQREYEDGYLVELAIKRGGRSVETCLEYVRGLPILDTYAPGIEDLENDWLYISFWRTDAAPMSPSG